MLSFPLWMTGHMKKNVTHCFLPYDGLKTMNGPAIQGLVHILDLEPDLQQTGYGHK